MSEHWLTWQVKPSRCVCHEPEAASLIRYLQYYMLRTHKLKRQSSKLKHQHLVKLQWIHSHSLFLFLICRNGCERSSVLYGALLSRSLCDREPERNGQTTCCQKPTRLHILSQHSQLSLLQCASNMTVWGSSSGHIPTLMLSKHTPTYNIMNSTAAKQKLFWICTTKHIHLELKTFSFCYECIVW